MKYVRYGQGQKTHIRPLHTHRTLCADERSVDTARPSLKVRLRMSRVSSHSPICVAQGGPPATGTGQLAPAPTT